MERIEDNLVQVVFRSQPGKHDIWIRRSQANVREKFLPRAASSLFVLHQVCSAISLEKR